MPCVFVNHVTGLKQNAEKNRNPVNVQIGFGMKTNYNCGFIAM